MQNVLKDLKKTMASSPTSPSWMPTASCTKHATSNWATAQSPLHSGPSAKKATPSSSTICSPPPPTYATPPLSRSPCGLLTPSPGSHLLITKLWTWPAVRMIEAWQPSSLAIMKPTPASSISQPRYTCSTVNCRLSRRLVVRVTATSRELAPNTVSEPSKPSTPVAPLALTRTLRVSALAVVGRHS